jgi:hypothetical protein
LSGGVFQNEFLLRRVVEDLQARQFKVFTNQLVPPNDGGLALGQVAVAVAQLAGERSRAANQIRGEATPANEWSGNRYGDQQPCV